MKGHSPIVSYPTVGFPSLEQLALGTCPCCGEKYSPQKWVNLISRCHPKRHVSASYWDGFIYLTCGKCRKPIVRIPVDKSLL